MSDIQAILAKLSEFDFIVVVDKSGSMGTEDIKGGRSRWNHVQETALQFTREISKIDSDGLGLVLFSGTSIDSYDGVDATKLQQAFDSHKPRGGTPLAEALTAAFQLAGKSDKKDFIIVFTDGVPDDKAAAAKVIVDQANSQANDDDCTILFVQVGYDKDAAAYLQSLDDGLKAAKFDIVDAKTQEEAEQFASTEELIIAAIND